MRRVAAVTLVAFMVTVGFPVAANAWTADAGDPAPGTAPASPAVAEPPELPPRLLDDPVDDRDRPDRAPLTTRLAEAAADGPLTLETLRDRFGDDRDLPDPDDGNRSPPSIPAVRDRMETERSRLLEAAKAPAAPPSVEADHESHCGYRVPHPPIEITEDQGPNGFVLGHEPVTGQPIYRPGSGVIAGTGTADDPYVIADLCIGARGVPEDADTALVGIEIRDTSAHVVIRDVGVRMPEDDAIGVRLDDADNVTLHRSDVRGGDLGVAVVSARNVALKWNTLAESRLGGAAIVGSSTVRVRDNLVDAEEGPGVLVSSSSDVTLKGNLVRGPASYDGYGIVVTGSQTVRAAYNEIRGGLAAIAVGGSPDARLTDNEIEEAGYGLLSYASDGTRLVDNRLRDTVFLSVVDSDGARIRDNDLDGDLKVRRSNRTRIVGNTLIGDGSFLSGSLEVGYARDVTIADNTVVVDDWYYATGIRVVETNVTRIRENTVRVEAPIFSFGVTSYDAENLLIEGNTVDQAGEAYVAAGMVVGDADASRIRRNTVRDSPDTGIVVAEVEQAILADNDVEGSAEAAILLYGSGDNTIEDNRLVGAGLRIDGTRLDDYTQAAVTGNTVNGEPLRYIEGATDVTVPKPVGQAILVDVSGARIADLGISDASVAIHAVYSEDVAIDNVTLSDNLYGVLGNEIANVSVARSDVRNSSEDGIRLRGTGSLDVTDTTVVEGEAGIVAAEPVDATPVPGVATAEAGTAASSANVTVARNRVLGARFDGIEVRSGGATIVDNRVHDGWAGIEVDGPGGSEISGNHLVDAPLTLDGSPDNLVASNTFVGSGLEIVGGGAGIHPGIGGGLAAWNQTVVGNTVNGEPLVYVRDATDVDVTEPAGQVILANVSTAHLANLSLTNATIGVQAVSSDDVTIRNATLTGNEIGVVGQQLDRSEISESQGAGIVLRGSNGTTVAGNQVTEGRYGVVATRSHGIEIVGNALGPGDVYGLGAGVYDSRRVEIAENRIEVGGGSYASGVVVYGSDRVDVTSGEIVGDGGRWGSGVWVGRSSRVVVADATIQQTGVGVSVAGSEEVEVRDSTMEDLVSSGVDVERSYFSPPSEDVELHHNRIANASIGVWAEEGDGIEIVANDITESRVAGIILYEDALVEDNNIWDNEIGLYAREATAEDNWWGCPAGPEAPICDDVEGEDVDYVPWRVTANPDAGPR